MKLTYFLIAILMMTGCTYKLEIPQIDFKTTACYGRCPIFTMSILGNGTAVYNAQGFNKKEGLFKAKIRKAQLDSLKTLIQNVDFFSLNDSYAARGTDRATYTLTIKDKNGRTKSIEDYGRRGPDKLLKIYNLLFSLRDSQSWK